MSTQNINFDLLVAQQRDEFFDQATYNRDKAEVEKIKQAYEFAEIAHRPQKRKSGEPYIIHPIAVARIVCVELQLSTNTIIAALLHDVVEDTPYTIEDIRSQFGTDVSFLVKVVTKEKKAEYENSKQIDNFRQMLDSIHYDIRALMLKLADRLHNMRTLASMRPDKQMKIAGETDYFYAPLANRLGLYGVKSELENLSFHYRSPEEYTKVDSRMQSYLQQESSNVEAFISPIINLLENQQIKGRVFAKWRSPYSVWRKMQRSGISFKQLEVKHIINVVFPEQATTSEKNQSLAIYSLISDIYKEKPNSFINYIDTPKENGYQSIHFKVMCKHGTWVEIHISSERMSYNSRMGCIAQRATGAEKWIEKFKTVLHDIAVRGKEGGFLEDVVSSFYQDDIIAFTPKGNSVVLPKGATALDFAYEIHSNIGNTAKYARINGKLCSIITELKRGDRVDVGTDEKVVPHIEWLEHVRSYKARRNIMAALRRNNSIPAHTYTRCPICHPIPGDEVVGFSINNKTIIHKRNCNEAISLSAREGEAIVEIDFTPSVILYPARIIVTSVNRDSLLIDLITVISKELHTSITNISSLMRDEIVTTTIEISIHSASEIYAIMTRLEHIPNVDEVRRDSLS